VSELTFKLTNTKIPFGPNSGLLYASVASGRELYFPNRQHRTFSTGVTLSIPQGTTVAIEGLYEQRMDGIEMIPQRLEGPMEDHEISVTVWNRANATVQLASYSAIATIRAYESPRPLLFAEHVDEVEVDPQVDDSDTARDEQDAPAEA